MKFYPKGTRWANGTESPSDTWHSQPVECESDADRVQRLGPDCMPSPLPEMLAKGTKWLGGAPFTRDRTLRTGSRGPYYAGGGEYCDDDENASQVDWRAWRIAHGLLVQGTQVIPGTQLSTSAKPRDIRNAARGDEPPPVGSRVRVLAITADDTNPATDVGCEQVVPYTVDLRTESKEPHYFLGTGICGGTYVTELEVLALPGEQEAVTAPGRESPTCDQSHQSEVLRGGPDPKFGAATCRLCGNGSPEVGAKCDWCGAVREAAPAEPVLPASPVLARCRCGAELTGRFARRTQCGECLLEDDRWDQPSQTVGHEPHEPAPAARPQRDAWPEAWATPSWEDR